MTNKIDYSKHQDKADGCSFSPDFNFKEVCNTHDIDYNFGGTEKDRRKADIKLFKGILKKKNIVIAVIYYVAVRLYGWTGYRYMGKPSYVERRGQKTLLVTFLAISLMLLGICYLIYSIIT